MELQFFIALGIILIICGGIFYYCYSRLNILEESVINQGKILQSFLLTQTTSGGSNIPNLNKNDNETENTEHTENTENTNDKIDISDDGDESEISENDQSESEESDNDSEDNNSEDDEDNPKLKLDKIDLPNNIGIVDINEKVMDTSTFVFSKILDVQNVRSSLNLEETKISEINDLDDDVDKIKIVDIENKNQELEEIEPSEFGETDETKKRNKSIHKMNNQELKDLILQRGVASNDDITKLKKSELIELLQNKDK